MVLSTWLETCCVAFTLTVSRVIVTKSTPWVWLTAGAGAKVQPLVTQLPTELKVTEGGF